MSYQLPGDIYWNTGERSEFFFTGGSISLKGDLLIYSYIHPISLYFNTYAGRLTAFFGETYNNAWPPGSPPRYEYYMGYNYETPVVPDVTPEGWKQNYEIH